MLLQASDMVRCNSLVLVGEEYVDRGETPESFICDGGEDKDLVEELGRGLEGAARMLRSSLAARMVTLL